MLENGTETVIMLGTHDHLWIEGDNEVRSISRPCSLAMVFHSSNDPCNRRLHVCDIDWDSKDPFPLGQCNMSVQLPLMSIHGVTSDDGVRERV